jgi:hypothetical protein
MAKCELGKQLFRDWKDAADVHDVFLARVILPMYRPEVTISREVAYERGMQAQTAFLKHSGVCDDCMYFDGRDED